MPSQQDAIMACLEHGPITSIELSEMTGDHRSVCAKCLEGAKDNGYLKCRERMKLNDGGRNPKEYWINEEWAEDNLEG